MKHERKSLPRNIVQPQADPAILSSDRLCSVVLSLLFAVSSPTLASLLEAEFGPEKGALKTKVLPLLGKQNANCEDFRSFSTR